MSGSTLEERLRRSGQAHLWEHLQSLEGSQRRAFQEQLSQVDFDRLRRIFLAATAQPATDVAAGPAAGVRPIEDVAELAVGMPACSFWGVAGGGKGGRGVGEGEREKRGARGRGVREGDPCATTQEHLGEHVSLAALLGDGPLLIHSHARLAWSVLMGVCPSAPNAMLSTPPPTFEPSRPCLGFLR